ncbi:MAG: squalene synthase HpnC [Ignavibacteriales bacterium]
MLDSEPRYLSETGYTEALKLARSHYENFPVVSLMIPRNLRKDVAIIYWFARTADDFSDEGNFSISQRLKKLQTFENKLNALLISSPESNLEAALKKTIFTRKLSPENFFNLMKAFKQDVDKNRYKDFNEVLTYCSNSANPVGRIMLELFNIRDERAFHYSDKICTALQITNFIQDTQVDYQKGRIYYPQDEMVKFEVDEKVFEMNIINLNFKKLIEFSVDRVQDYFHEGRTLLEFLSGRFKYEIAWTIKGGEEILNKIRGANFDIFTKRAALTKTDYLKLCIKSFFTQ